MDPVLKVIIDYLYSLRPASISVSYGDVDITAEFANDQGDGGFDFDPEGEPAPKPEAETDIEYVSEPVVRLAVNGKAPGSARGER